MSRDFRPEIEGYAEIRREIEVLRRYGFDYSSYKGRVEQVLDLLHPKKIRMQVSEIREEAPSAKSFRLVSPDGYLPPFQAGQYINLFVDVGGIRTSRPYSISSPPNQGGYYEIAVRRVEDGFVSNHLLETVKVNDRLESTGPSGNFYYNPLFHGNDLVFLAGGSGITPFMSMIREVTDRGLPRRIHLIYGSRKPDDMIFGEELQERARLHEYFKMTSVISEPPEGYEGFTGFITAKLLKDVLGNMEGKTFYLCGPEAMYTFCLPELLKLRVPARKIRMEVFGPPKDVTAQPGWPEMVSADSRFQVMVKGRKKINGRAGEPLMISLERAGIVIPASCRSGECSLCRTKLLSGKVFQPPGVKLRKSDRTYGYIHPCVAYPLQDLEIMIS
jgi:ferredoxin-NADP reductase